VFISGAAIGTIHRMSVKEGGWSMARHSFIQIEKIKDIKGRIHYISSHAKQENLYAAMNTTDVTFWRQLSKESQREFQKSGAEGTCIEARELIIALPEVYTDYEPQQVLELFTNTFKNRHGVECISALHHNKKKTNYHIHLIFSERKILEEPGVKIASRNMFYNEQGKHVRTKKEILDTNGDIRKGCRIVTKGNVYEQRLFSNKEQYLKRETFLEAEKRCYTKLINQFTENPEERLEVFAKNSIYLPTKKIGKNNPKSEAIKADNEVRVQWNQTVDMALVEGIPEAEIMKVKKEEISQKVWKSIKEQGKKPGLFQGIVLRAKKILEYVIEKFKIPPKPQMTVDIREFREMQYTHEQLIQQSRAIRRIEQEELPELKHQLTQLGGIFKKKERKMVESKIADKEVQLENMRNHLGGILSKTGYKNGQDFMDVYRRSEAAVYQYKQDLQRWKEQAGTMRPEKESIRQQIRRYQEEGKNEPRKPMKSKSRGAR